MTGSSILDAGSGGITLSDANNHFDGVMTLHGGDVTISAGSLLTLGNIDAGGLSLNVPQDARMTGVVTAAPVTLAQGSLEISATSGTSAALMLDSGTSVTGTGTVGTIMGTGETSPGAPGSTSGSLSAAGYTPSSGSTLRIHADAAGSTQLAVSGAATLQGNLVLDFSGALPSSGTTYTVLTAGNISGQFSSVTTNRPGMTATTQYSPTAVTVSIDTSPALTLDIDDGADYAPYGAVNDYKVTLSNNGVATADGLTLDGTFSAAFDAANASWQCSASGGAQCTASGTGPLHDTAISLPVGGTATWDISAPLTLTGNEAFATAAVALTGSATLDADDTDTLVLFRDGFDTVDEAPTVALHAGDVHAITLPAATPRAIDTVLVAQLDDGSHVLVQRDNLAPAPRLRLLWKSPDLGDIAGSWVDAAADAELLLRCIEPAAGQTPVLQLEGAAVTLSMPPEPVAPAAD